MNINLTLEINIEVIKLEPDKLNLDGTFINENEVEKSTITLILNSTDIRRIMFANNDIFKLGDYSLLFKFNSKMEKHMLMINKKDNEYSYFCLTDNLNHFLDELSEGYVRIRTLEKVASFFETVPEVNEIKDEIFDEFDEE